MSNDGVGKIKLKRKNVTSKPYARTQSFLGKVKDTVKEIFQPSWLGSIVSSFKPAAAKSESAPSTPMPQQVKPDSQFSSSTPRRNAYPLNSLHRPSRGAPQTNMYSTVDGHLPFGTYGSNNQPSSSNHGGGGLGFEEQANISEYALSSGLMPATQTAVPRQEESYVLDDSRTHDPPQRKEIPKQDEPTVKRGRTTPELDISVMSQSQDTSSFFGKPSKRARTTGPQFNISLFTTPRPSSDGNSSMMSSFQQSPYYPGKTTYGGAASHRKSRLKATAAYQSNLSVRKVTPKPLNKSAGGTVTSSTARKILDALESMPSVLHDAKRIPVNNSSLFDSPLSFTPSSFPRRRSLQPHTSRQGTPAGAPPTSRVNVLGVASIAKNRQYLLPVREQQPAEEKRPAEKEKTVSVPAPAPPASTVDTPHHGSGKMRREKGHHYHVHKDEEDDVVEVPDLPTKFVLPSDGFKLNIDVKAPQPKTKSPAVTATPPQFTFSSPIQKISSPVTASPGAATGFQFSSPIAFDEQKKEEKTMPSNRGLSSEMMFAGSSGLKLKTKPQAKEVPVNSGIAAASELKKGSVMDILGKSSAFAANKSSASSVTKSSASADTKKQEPVNINSFLNKMKPAAGSWECPACMINNKPDATKCVACTTSKPAEKKEAPAPAFKPLIQQSASGSWECPVCMINNKADKETCAACQARKPAPASKKTASISAGTPSGWDCPVCLLVNSADMNTCIACTAPKPAKKPPAPKAIAPDRDLIAKLKPPEGSWDCPACMVANKSSEDKCVCCGTGNPKPKRTMSNSSTVSVKTDPTLYEKLKQPAGNWECPVCMIQNKQSDPTCVACTTPNPNKSVKSSPKVGNALSKRKNPEENWTCDTCLVPNNATALKCVACETPKPGATKASGFAKPGGFSFAGSSGSGFVLGAVSSSSALFSFGGAKSSDSDSKPKTTESISGGFKFGATSDSSSSGGFGSGSTSASNGFKFGGVSNVSDTKVSAPNSLFTFGAKAPEAKKETKSDSAPGGFKFGESSKNSAISGIQFGQASSESKETTKTIAGFAFNAGSDANKTSALAGALSSSTGSASLGGGSKTTDTSSAAGGFTFGGTVKPKADDESTPKQAAKITFGGPSTSLSQPKKASESEKKENGSIGGFAFKPIATTTPATGSESKGFAFQAGSTKTSLSAFSSDSTEPSAKRKHDGGSSGAGFAFGQSNSSSSTPTFGQSTNPAPATSSATFKFGAVDNPVPPSVSSTATFNFGQPASASSSSTGGFAFGQAASSGPAASASNPATSTFKFGAQPASSSSTPASTGGFNFGQSATAPVSSSATFQFGQPAAATSSASSAAPGGFAFGQSASTTQSATTTSTFTFGATSTSKAPSFGGFNATPAQPTAAPSFGAAATAPAFGQQQASTPAAFGSSTATPFGGQSTGTSFSQATPAFGATAPAAPAFGAGATALPAFGSTPTTTPTATPAFGAGSTGFGTQASAPPAFGAQTTTAAGFNFSASAQTSFNFGAQQQASSGTFQFGASKPGQPNPVASQPAATQGFAFNATPNMNFGGSAAPAAPQQAFQFSAAPAPAPGVDGNPFSVNPSPNIAGRKIKRATRKLKGR